MEYKFSVSIYTARMFEEPWTVYDTVPPLLLNYLVITLLQTHFERVKSTQ